jgi:anti-sigma factor RsiW
MKKCNAYPPDKISRFMDKDLSKQEMAQLEKHLATCPTCRQLVNRYKRLGDGVIRMVHQQVPPMETAALEHALLKKIRSETQIKRSLTSPFKRFMDFIQGKKFYLQMASFAAILLLSTLFLKDQEKVIRAPSAIVNSIDGNMASVMILETREQRHTIIWYKET